MRLAMFEKNGRVGIAASADGAEFHGAFDGDADYPGDLDLLIGQGADLREAGRRYLLNAPFEQKDVKRRALRLDVTWAVGIQGWDDRAS